MKDNQKAASTIVSTQSSGEPYSPDEIRIGVDNGILRIADAARRQMALGRPLDLDELSRHLKGIELLPTPKPKSVDRAVAEKTLYREQRNAKAREKRRIVNRKPIEPNDRPVSVSAMVKKYGYSRDTLTAAARLGHITSKQPNKGQWIKLGERSVMRWHSHEEATKHALALSLAGKPLTREEEQLVDVHYAKKSRTV
jgi:hypothetical protein